MTEINGKDAALVITENWEINLILPKQENNEDAHENSVIVSLLGVMLGNQDAEFSEFMTRKQGEYLADENSCI
mgnify:CR=1 FL=1